MSYFDEGVFGGGIGGQGVVCFDGAGTPTFRFAEFAEKYGLPIICDCYAMNVSSEDEVWLNYYTDFPLVRLSGFHLDHVWSSLGVVGDGFAINGTKALYLRNGHLMSIGLALPPDEPQEVASIDDQGNRLNVEQDRTQTAGRGSSFALNTGTAIYELAPEFNQTAQAHND